jgi:putative peptidoglycan lipid II flippase
MIKRFTETIAGASIFISILMLVSRGFGFLREVVFAGYFGTGEQFDLYLVGAVLPITINTIIFYLGQNYFIPAYNKFVISRGSEASFFATQIFVKFIFGGIILSGLLFLVSDLIINLYLHSSSIEICSVANSIFRIFLMTIPLMAGISILSAYLQAKLEFRYPALSRLFLNLFCF